MLLFAKFSLGENYYNKEIVKNTLELQHFVIAFTCRKITLNVCNNFFLPISVFEMPTTCSNVSTGMRQLVGIIYMWVDNKHILTLNSCYSWRSTAFYAKFQFPFFSFAAMGEINIYFFLIGIGLYKTLMVAN